MKEKNRGFSFISLSLSFAFSLFSSTLSIFTHQELVDVVGGVACLKKKEKGEFEKESLSEFFPVSELFFPFPLDAKETKKPDFERKKSSLLTDVPAKDHEHVRHVQRPVDGPPFLLAQGHRAAHCGDVRVVPCVVVDDDGLKRE
jgi:hypothetical protein